MRELGLLERCLDAGFQYDRSIFCDAAGRTVVEVKSSLGAGDLPAANALPRGILHEILTDAVASSGAALHYGAAVADLVVDGGEAHVTFSDAGNASYDLVVAFDGVRSTARSKLFSGSAEPRYTGHSVWRLTVARPPEVTCPMLFQARFAKAGVIPLGAETMYLLVVTSESDGALRYRKADLSDLLRERLAEFSGLIADIRDAPIAAEGVVYSPIEEVFLPEPWHRGAAVVAGDAAHASAPHLAQGAAMAMEDAAVLAELLTETTPMATALRRWCLRRYPRCQRVQEASRAILSAESFRDEEPLANRLGRMRDDMPTRLHEIQEMLNQPA